MSEVKVSVVIPVYNVEKFIGECVASVCKQTLKEIEILLVDDGSTDNGADVCEEWVKKDSRVRLIRQPNQGVSVARNRGVAEAKGAWIAFIDSDDWIEPDYIQVLYDNAVKTKADISICGFYFDYSDETVARGHFEKDMVFAGRQEVSQIQIQILAKNMSTVKNNSGDRIGAPWCKLYNTEFIRKNGLEFIPDLKRSQDVVFNLYALEQAGRVAYKNIPLYHYRINEESVCSKFSKQILENVNNYLREMQRFIAKYHKRDAVFADAFNTKVCTSVYKCMFQYFFDERYPGSYAEMKRELKEYLSQKIFVHALQKVKYQNLDKTEKVFVFCLKHWMIAVLLLLVKMRQRFIKIFRH